MDEIKVGDKVNISAEVIEISGNLCNEDMAELRFENGFKIKVPISAISNESKIKYY